MTDKILSQLLIVIWAVALAFLTLAGLGATGVFSFLFGEKRVLVAVDIAFPVLSVVFGMALWRFAPRLRSLPLKMAAFLPPCLLLLFLLV